MAESLKNPQEEEDRREAALLALLSVYQVVLPDKALELVLTVLRRFEAQQVEKAVPIFLENRSKFDVHVLCSIIQNACPKAYVDRTPPPGMVPTTLEPEPHPRFEYEMSEEEWEEFTTNPKYLKWEEKTKLLDFYSKRMRTNNKGKGSF